MIVPRNISSLLATLGNSWRADSPDIITRAEYYIYSDKVVVGHEKDYVNKDDAPVYEEDAVKSGRECQIVAIHSPVCEE